MEQASDSRLVEFAQAGDQQAFAELYNRYFDPVYDFVARMTRNRDEAADIAQDTFLKAMNSLGGLQKGASFKGWIFTIARNTALNRLERAKRTRPLAFEDAEGEEVSFDVIDTDRFADPAEAAQAGAMAALVWEAAAGLDPKQLSLLDLHLRQGLDSAEIADVLGVTKNNGYVMLNRLKKAVEDSIGAFIMFKDGRRYCDDLNAALGAEAGPLSPEIRKMVERHVAQCERCEERKKKLVAPLAVFGAFAMVGSPAGTKAGILEHLMRQWPGPAAGAPPPGATGGGGAGEGAPGKVVKVFAALGMAAAVMLLLLLVPASPIALTRSDGQDVVAAGAGSPAASPSATSNAIIAGASPTASPSPTTTTAAGQANASVTPSASPSAASPSPTPNTGGGPVDPPKQTATPTSGPGSPTPTTIAPTPTTPVTPTTVPTATSTPQPCTPTLTPSVSSVNALSGATSFDILNSFCKQVQFTAAPDGSGWFDNARKSGTLQPGERITIDITANPAAAGEGAHSGGIHVAWPDGSFDVTVSVNNSGAPPTIVRTTQTCVRTSNNFTVTAVVTDDFGVTGVTLVYTTVNGSPVTVSMQLTAGSSANGTWKYTGAGALASYTVVATDGGGHSKSATGGC